MKMKIIPEDFLVQEVLTDNYSLDFIGLSYIILLLKKKMYTTFEAIDLISNFFDIPAEIITYAGLKDEDGITYQKICIPLKYKSKIQDINKFNTYYNSEKRYISLILLGFSKKPIKIGRLGGNAFRIKLRDMDEKLVKYCCSLKKYLLFFPNYYGVQRFGIPGEKKVTHLIGEKLIEKNYKEAYQYLKLSNTPESYLILKSNYDSFFEQLDKRKLSFYYNAFTSYQFNNSLHNIIEEKKEKYIEKEYSEVKFKFLYDRKGILSLIDNDKIEIKRFYESNNVLEEKKSFRQSIQSTEVSFIKYEEDIFFPGKYCLTISFFLTSGTYATVAIDQLQVLFENIF